MDILGKYEADRPQVIKQPHQFRTAPEYGFFVRIVMRLSGDRIQDARQASMVLLGCAGVCFLIALSLFYLSRASSVDTENFKDKTRAPQVLP